MEKITIFNADQYLIAGYEKAEKLLARTILDRSLDKKSSEERMNAYVGLMGIFRKSLQGVMPDEENLNKYEIPQDVQEIMRLYVGSRLKSRYFESEEDDITLGEPENHEQAYIESLLDAPVASLRPVNTKTYLIPDIDMEKDVEEVPLDNTLRRAEGIESRLI